MSNRAAEILWGEQQEGEVLGLWAEHSPFGARGRRFVKSGPTDPYDVFVFGDSGLPLCALEIKVRRVELARYGDVMVPMSKHRFASAMRKHAIPFFSVTLYSCGSLVQVNLEQPPDASRFVVRSDRPGTDPVDHAFYKGGSLVVLRGAA